MEKIGRDGLKQCINKMIEKNLTQLLFPRRKYDCIRINNGNIGLVRLIDDYLKTKKIKVHDEHVVRTKLPNSPFTSFSYCFPAYIPPTKKYVLVLIEDTRNDVRDGVKEVVESFANCTVYPRDTYLGMIIIRIGNGPYVSNAPELNNGRVIDYAFDDNADDEYVE